MQYLFFYSFLPESIVTVSYFLIVKALSIYAGTSFTYPAVGESIFIGKHYFIGLLLGGFGSVALSIFNPVTDGLKLASIILHQLVYIFFFLVVIWLHFHVKMWIPLINNSAYDELYNRIDIFFSPLIKQIVGVREILGNKFEGVDGFYLDGFMLIFAISFFIHSTFDSANIKKIVLSSMLVQSIGSLSYLIMPAIGPFIYMDGLNPFSTQCQNSMIDGYRSVLQYGVVWLDHNGHSYFMQGLAAMPSLHVGASWVFLYYAYQYKPYLLIIYIPIFLWILVEAISARWHYVIDLPMGLLLAVLCISLSDRILRVHSNRA